MKTKVTKNNLYKPMAAGYCELQCLLRYRDPFGYNSGVYGWNYDAYFVHGVTICTGYRNIPGKRLKQCKEYNDKAREVIENSALTYDEKRERVENLLDEFIKINM